MVSDVSAMLVASTTWKITKIMSTCLSSLWTLWYLIQLVLFDEKVILEAELPHAYLSHLLYYVLLYFNRR